MSALYARGNAILPLTGAASLVDKEGCAVTISGATATLSASATTVARGIVLDGNDTDEVSSIGIISNLQAPVRVKLHSATAAVVVGDTLVQASDGTWTKDTGSGSRVQSFTALEAGTADALIVAAPQTPLSLS